MAVRITIINTIIRDMTKLNFKEFHVPTGISGESHKVVDAREAIADLIYLHTNGIKSHHLAFKIYRSEGVQDYNDEECGIIRISVERYCLPSIIDALHKQLEGGGK